MANLIYIAIGYDITEHIDEDGEQIKQSYILGAGLSFDEAAKHITDVAPHYIPLENERNAVTKIMASGVSWDNGIFTIEWYRRVDND
jgi:hypothetical protein